MRFLSITEFKDAFGYSKVNSQAIDDNTILYYLDRASLQVDTLTGANILKGIDAGAWIQNPDSSIVVNPSFFPDPAKLQEAKRALEMVRESIGLYTKFALDTGYDFIGGSFSSSLGSQSSTENIDFNNSLLMLEHKVKSLLANFNFARIITIENISLEHEISYSSTSKKEKEYLTRDEFFSYISNPQSGGVIQAGTGIKIEKTNPQNEAAGITISTEGGSTDARITALENKLTFNGVANDSFKNNTDAVATRSWVNGIQQEIQNQIVPDITELNTNLDALSTTIVDVISPKIDVLEIFKADIEGIDVITDKAGTTKKLVDLDAITDKLASKASINELSSNLISNNDTTNLFSKIGNKNLSNEIRFFDSGVVQIKTNTTQLITDGTLNLSNNKLVNLAAGTAPTDAVNKSQLDAATGGGVKTWKQKQITTGTLNLSVLDDGDLINIFVVNAATTPFSLSFGGVFQKNLQSGVEYFISGFTTSTTSAINVSFRYSNLLVAPASPIQWFARTLSGNTATNGVIVAYTIRYYSNKTLA